MMRRIGRAGKATQHKTPKREDPLPAGDEMSHSTMQPWIQTDQADQADQADPVLYLPQALLRQTHDMLFASWRAQVETACFWCGIESESGRIQVVTTVALPYIEQTTGAYRLDRTSVRHLADRLSRQGLVIVAQVHTHPPSAGTRHSRYDDGHAYSTREHALSLVWPDYGLRSAFSLDDLGVHERRHGQWVHLSAAAVSTRIHLIDSLIDLHMTSLTLMTHPRESQSLQEDWEERFEDSGDSADGDQQRNTRALPGRRVTPHDEQ